MVEEILIILFTLFFAWVAWWKLDWAIALCLIFLPTYLLRFQAWFVPMTVLEVMVLVIFVVWLAKIIRQGQGTIAARFKSVNWPWKWLTLLFVLSGVAAVIVSPDKRQALGLWKAYIVEPILFFIVFVNTIKTKEQVRVVIWALGASVVLLGYVALLQYAGLLGIPDPYGLQVPKRATSVFPFPTAVGKYFAPLVAFFLGIWLTRGAQAMKPLWEFVRKNIFIGGVLLFGALGLLFSFSRGAIIGVFAGLVFISFFSRWKKWLWSALILLVLACLFVPFTRHEIFSIFSAKDVSADVHVVMWKGAVRIIKANPVLGTGLASFPAVYEKYKEASHTEFFPNPDHLILTLWIEMGLFGLIVFAWLVVRFFKTGFKLIRGLPIADYRLQLVVGLLAAMVAIVVHGFFDTPYFKNDLAVEFWALVGLLVVLQRQLAAEKII